MKGIKYYLRNKLKREEQNKNKMLNDEYDKI